MSLYDQLYEPVLYTITDVNNTYCEQGIFSPLGEYYESRFNTITYNHTQEVFNPQDVDYYDTILHGEKIIGHEKYPWTPVKYRNFINTGRIVYRLDLELYNEVIASVTNPNHHGIKYLHMYHEEKKLYPALIALNLITCTLSFSENTTVETLLSEYQHIIDAFFSLAPTKAPRAILPQLFLTITNINKRMRTFHNQTTIRQLSHIEGMFYQYTAHMVALLAIAEGHLTVADPQNFYGRKSNIIYTTILADRYLDSDITRLLFIEKDYYNHNMYRYSKALDWKKTNLPDPINTVLERIYQPLTIQLSPAVTPV